MRISDWSSDVCSSDLACWPFLRENARLILFGTYPEVEQWRSAAAAAALLSCLAFSFVPRFWRSRLGLVWLGAIAVAVLLLRGGFAGLSYVPMEKDRKSTRLNSSH